MSGVFGIVRFDGGAVADEDLARQARALAHLGPDGAARWSGGAAGLGALVMRVSREDGLDRAPIRHAPCGITFVADARIDNREAVAAQLLIDDDALAGMSDRALLFEAFRRWGEDCVERLVGDFAFAAWEQGRRTLTLARDHMGQRRLFFHKGDGFLAFATEPRGLHALPDVPRRLPSTLIARVLLLNFNTPPQAPTDGVEAVAGGAVVTVSADGEVVSRRYWRPRPDPVHLNRDEAYYIQAYRDVLGEAVACRLRRGLRPAGLLMSGGFDTGAICALAGPALAGQGRKLVAAASVMPEGYRGDIRHARPWVELFRRDMAHLDVRYLTREGLTVVNGLERAFLTNGSGHSANFYVNDALYALIASTGARTVMDGFGGDYTLNPRGYGFLFGLLTTGRLRLFGHEWRARRRFVGGSHGRLFKQSILPFIGPSLVNRWRRYRTGLSPFGATMPVARDFVRAAVAAGAPRPKSRPTSMRGMMLRTLETLQDAGALAGSIAAAAHGLELTQPFHDKRVIELALAIPETLHVKDGRERHLAREALKDLYPREFQTRGPGNDDVIPDFLAMAKSIEPEVLAEINRMEAAGKLGDYFDFSRMRRMLTRRRPDQHASGNEFDTRQALAAFIWARYIEWFRGDNG